MLHVLNGDSTRQGLQPSGLPGDMTVWADVLHDGPTPGGLTREAFREVRASHLATLTGQPGDEILHQLAAWDAALDAYRDHDEVVFWFEHDLFDQLILLRHLHWRSGLDAGRTRFSLICIDRFPGVPRFTGLGQLTPEQLATLLPQRQPLAAKQIELGAEGWERFCSPEPAPLLEWLRTDTSALPFVRGALVRHLEDYPSNGDGLSRSERQMLAAIAGGAQEFGMMFRACQQAEERVFMGDVSFLGILRGLADAREPPITLAGERRTPGRTLRAELTHTGQDVLAGRIDHLEVNGIDRWMGGVHLTTGRHWRM